MLKVVEDGALREASWDLFELDEIALAGARRMLMAALKANVSGSAADGNWRLLYRVSS
jgi:hypothetical protein